MTRNQILGILFFFLVYPASGQAVESRLYVIGQSVSLRMEPAQTSPLVDTLGYGTELRKLNVRGGWFEVEAVETKNHGWVFKKDVGERSPILASGYGKLAWGAGKEETIRQTSAVAEGERLIESRGNGPVEAVAYNFRDGRLWFVEERLRLPLGSNFDDVADKAREQFGKPHSEGVQRWSEKGRGAGEEVPMEARYFRWDTGPTGFALVSYGPLFEDGKSEVRAEYWSTELAREAGLWGKEQALDGLRFGGD